MLLDQPLQKNYNLLYMGHLLSQVSSHIANTITAHPTIIFNGSLAVKQTQ